MAKEAFVGIGGKAQKVKEIYIGVDGKARKVKEGYIGVNGVARLFYASEFSLNWKESSFPHSYYGWNGVTYGSGKYLLLKYDMADGTTNTYHYSTNGINWQEKQLPESASWEMLIYLKDRFMIKGYRTSLGYYSKDGINWYKFNFPYWNVGNYYRPIYAKNKFISLGRDQNNVFYSTDGINWEIHSIEPSLPSGTEWGGLVYGNNRFITYSTSSTGTKNSKIIYSDDGINWNVAVYSLPYSATYRKIVYGNGMFVENGSNRDYGKIIYYSTDGINWNSTYTPYGFSSYKTLDYINGKFVGKDPYGYSLSTDGINWESVSLPSGQWSNMVGCNNKFIIASLSGDNKLIYSTDGINWIPAGLAPVAISSGNPIYCVNNKFFINTYAKIYMYE